MVLLRHEPHQPHHRPDVTNAFRPVVVLLRRVRVHRHQLDQRVTNAFRPVVVLLLAHKETGELYLAASPMPFGL